MEWTPILWWIGGFVALVLVLVLFVIGGVVLWHWIAWPVYVHEIRDEMFRLNQILATLTTKMDERLEELVSKTSAVATNIGWLAEQEEERQLKDDAAEQKGEAGDER